MWRRTAEKGNKEKIQGKRELKGLGRKLVGRIFELRSSWLIQRGNYWINENNRQKILRKNETVLGRTDKAERTNIVKYE